MEIKNIVSAVTGISVIVSDFYNINNIRSEALQKAALRAAREELNVQIRILDRAMSNAGMDQ